MTHLQVEQRKL